MWNITVHSNIIDWYLSGTCWLRWSIHSRASTFIACCHSGFTFCNSVWTVFFLYFLHVSLCLFDYFSYLIRGRENCNVNLFAPSWHGSWICRNSAWVNLISEPKEWEKSLACIGETTAAAAKRLGLKNIYYPKNPGLEG